MGVKFIGIDPGLDGAIAFIEENGDISIMDMPTLEYKLQNKKIRREVNVGQLFNRLMKCEPYKCYLEGVAGMPGMSGTGMFAFGQSYGMIKAALVLAAIPYEIVSPQKWKNHYGLSKDKAASISTAKLIFPNASEYLARKKDDGRAEALLIANYARHCAGLSISENKRKTEHE